MATIVQGGPRRGRTQIHTLPWHKDPEILARLQLVEMLWHQPLNIILTKVNEQLATRGLKQVGYQTIKEDRRKVLELARERVLAPGKDSLIEHQLGLMTLLQQAMRDALGMQPGPGRAPLYAIALRCQEDLMRIDGTWQRGTAGILEEDDESAEERFAPDPESLREAGIVTQADVAAHLRLLAARGRKQLIEGHAVDITGQPNRAPEPGSAAAARGPLPRRKTVPKYQPPPPPPPDYPSPQEQISPEPILRDYEASPWE